MAINFICYEKAFFPCCQFKGLCIMMTIEE